ncbi:MAG TPA: hypothetical protein PK950_02605 [Candidatus Paceibacterota bacterium]|nr:hypothetical protein [Candidatus Paceibacterota bacterium]
MKNIKYIIVLAIIVVLAIVASKNWKTKEELAALNNTNETPSETGSAAFCYIWNTEAGDSATLKLITSDGIDVTGTFDYVPFEKDSKKGTIKGSVGALDEVAMQQEADLLWTVKGEGLTNVEELSIILGAGTAKVGFGEMKLDPITGIYKYADKSKVTYEPTLQRTECTDVVIQ